jgi:hypothetical protein
VAPLFRVARDTRQPRHQGPNRHLGRVGISLYESLSISRITITSRNSSVSSSSAVRIIAVSALRTAPASTGFLARRAMHLLVEFSRRLRTAVALEPREPGVAHNRENPRARIAAAKSAGTGVRAGTLPALPPVRRGHHAPAIGVPGIQQRQERAGEIDGFGFVRQSPFFARMSPVSCRLRARQFYSRLTLSLDRGNFFTRFESCL